MILRKVTTILFFSLIIHQLNGQNNLVKATQIIDRDYAELVKKTKTVGASIAIIDQGEVVYQKGFGFADRENNVQATPNTMYKVASVTKSFTAFAVMQLHEKG
ncbi:MAG: serine hydrolase domain-containing protein, partial [Bacteroidota bacterium]